MDLREFLSQLAVSPMASVTYLVNNIGQNWPYIIAATVVFVVVRKILITIRQRTRVVISAHNRKEERAKARRSLLASVAIVLLWVAWILILLGQAGVTLSRETSGWVIGASTIAVALATQNLLKDLLAGWHIIAEDQFGVGDYITSGIDFGGIVQGIGLRTTKLKGGDGTIFHIRNSTLDKIGNRTQSSGALLVDIELTPAEEHFITPAEAQEWENLILNATIGLRGTLHAAQEIVAGGTPTTASVQEVASVVPSIAPNLSAADLNAVAGSQTGDLQAIRDALVATPTGLTPVLRDIEILGITSSTTTSITLRMRVRLVEQTSRSYALALVRRCVWKAFAERRVATNITEVPEGEFIF